MTDVATLGLAVDSSQVDKGKISLDQLSNAAKRAQAAASGVSASTKNAGQAAVTLSASAGRAAASLNSEAAAAQKAASAMQVHSKAMNDNMVRVNRMGGSMSGLAAQFQDIGVTAAMGMNPMIVGLQQGTQIAGQMEMAMQSGSSAVGVLGTAFRSLFSPLTFVSIALTALAAGLFQVVDWVSLGQSALIGLADVLQTVAPYATMAAAGLALLYAPAILGGVKALTLGILGAARAAGAAAIAFAAANPAVAFVLGITAAVAAANIFRDELAKIFGRDIVDDAKKAVNWVVGAFVGGYEAIKVTWNDLPAVMGDLSFQTGEAFLGGVNAMLNAATDAIKRFYLTVLNPVAGAAKAVGFDTLSKWTGGNLLDGFNANASMGGNRWAGAASQAAADASAAMQGAMNIDYVGKGYEIIAKGASAAAGKIKDLAKWLETVDEKKEKKGGKTEGEKYDDIVDGANRRIAALKAEAAGLGHTEEESLRLQYTQDLLNQAQQKGLTLTAAQKAELAGLAGEMAHLEVATRAAKAMQEAWNDAGKSFGGILKGLLDGTTSWKDALLQTIPVVLKLLNSMNLAQGGKGLFGGGFFQSLLGGLLGIGFADGGFTGAGAASQPAGFVHAGEYVFSKPAVDRLGIGYLDSLHGLARGYRDGGVVERVYSAANNNLRGFAHGGYVPVAASGGGGAIATEPARLDVYVHAEEGKMFRPVIRAESQGVAVKVVQAAAPGIVQGSVSATQGAARNRPGFFR